MFAAVLGLFLLIEADSEFEYCDWKRSKKETGGDLGSGGPEQVEVRVVRPAALAAVEEEALPRIRLFCR